MTEVELLQSRPRLLFVDDDPALGPLFRRTVKQFNYDADIARCGDEALALARKHSYPIVITDLIMPDTDGLTLMEQISAIDPQTTFVLITGSHDLRLRGNTAIDSQIASVLVKPWDSEQLASTLRRALELHERRRSSSPAQKGTVSMIPTDILLVEDNLGDAHLVKAHLRKLPNAHVVHVTRLRDAVALLHEQPFDTIITDLSLPDARGLDAVLRLQEAAPEATVVALTALDDEALSLQVVECGAQDYLVKERVDAASLARCLRHARERKRCAQRLTELARKDSLTGLANRSGFHDRINLAVARARRLERRFAVMFLDLDCFKEINDQHGHDVGDTVLQVIGTRLAGIVRPYDVVARLGGDEFAVLLDDLADTGEIQALAERIAGVFVEPIVVGDVSHELTASMGIAAFPDAGDNPAELLRCADQAMYVAKRRGRNRFHVYVADGRSGDTDSVPAPPQT
ncbi:MAG TPA: diguanylate cyclase [Polyangiales bacterium]|nr:diguanylate cyclase [Polyangiales bacterium]